MGQAVVQTPAVGLLPCQCYFVILSAEKHSLKYLLLSSTVAYTKIVFKMLYFLLKHRKECSLNAAQDLGYKISEQTQLLRKLHKEQSSGFCLLRTLAKTFGPYFLTGTLCLVIQDAFMFSIPQVLR